MMGDNNIEAWLKEHNYCLPEDEKNYPEAAIVPFYKAGLWEAKGYTAVGEPILYLDITFGDFWQKVVRCSKKTNHEQNFTDSILESEEGKYADIASKLSKALSYVDVCIQASREGETETYHASVVLEDAKNHLLDVLEIFEGMKNDHLVN